MNNAPAQLPFAPAELVLHRPSEQRMRVERRVPSFFKAGGDAYWCTWRTLAGTTRRAMYAADELERLPDSDAARDARAFAQPGAATLPSTPDYGTLTTDHGEVGYE